MWYRINFLISIIKLKIICILLNLASNVLPLGKIVSISYKSVFNQSEDENLTIFVESRIDNPNRIYRTRRIVESLGYKLTIVAKRQIAEYTKKGLIRDLQLTFRVDNFYLFKLDKQVDILPPPT